MNLYLLTAFSFISSFIITYIIYKIALSRSIISIPNERSLHSTPTPVGGGLAIIIAWYTSISVLYFFDLLEQKLFLALLSGIILTIVSLIDDLTELKPSIRLVFQFITAILAFYFLGGLRQFIIPSFDIDYRFILYPVTVIGIVWFINLFNFMDGVDGFASLEAIIISLLMFFLSGSAINLILIASVSGFLYWNWPKAKIFMGDVGSTQLGFILVVLGIYAHNTLQFSILNWIMISSPFWFDATLTLYRRWRNGEKLGEAHRKHTYQRLVRAGFSHLQVDMFLLVLNLIVVVMILIYREIKFMQIPLFVLTISLFYFITRQVDKRVPFK